jgi:hypothetical protein
MPSGRCGGFIVETADLKQLVQAISNDAVVGQVGTGGRLQATRAVEMVRLIAVEMVRLIEECSDSRVNVEDQDHELYLIHLIDDYGHRSDDEPKIVLGWSPFRIADFLGPPAPPRSVDGRTSGWDGWMAF